ncbi:putative ABC transporter permease [Fulvivirga imtechensis AK7]|uniref:Putative ABC transporter permease n=1 Tax=Fulvivirga imtechensis AK7 TaxID=1237149 RepID=L8JRZ5_9BACT|nr:ABC transporter permease [Fulvivirga imtechensis]ELR70142.1 putative ABC transporter permease [Fulvivirga imtechensis AK7]
MLKNYFKIALRNLRKHKFYSIVNIFGLTVGLTSVIFILLYVVDELGYDKFHKDHDRVFRVVENQYYAGQPVFPVAVTPGPLAPSLKDEYPEVTHATRVQFTNNQFEYGDQHFLERGIYVDQEFLDIFSFELVNGDTKQVFEPLNALVINETLVAKYFPEQDPIGKTIRINGKDDMMVTGVFKDVPKNSHLQFDYLMSTKKLGTTWKEMSSAWSNNTLYTYIKISEDANIKILNEKIKGQIKKYKEGSVTDIYLQPLTDIHLGEVSFTADISGKGNRTYVEIFSIVAAFILVIACINFMNLSTARSARRAKEVGLRKTVGASRFQLIYQFLGESVLLSLVSVLLSILLVDLLLPSFNQLSEKTLELDLLNPENGLKITALMAVAVIGTGLLAGSYPAIFLSSFQPANVLKSKNSKTGGSFFRKVLVVLQFTVSIVLMIGTITVSTQLSFIQSKNLGINKEQVVYISSLSDNHEIFQHELMQQEGIKSVGFTNQHPAYVENSTSGISWEGANPDETILIHLQAVDPGYITTMQIEMAEGRNFSEEIASDSNAVIINQQALKTIGYEKPIGGRLRAGDKQYTIVGVAKDFHFKSIHQPIEPLIMFMSPQQLSRTVVKIDGRQVGDAMAKIEGQWQKLNPKKTFRASFLDEDFDKLYAAEKRTATLFKYFATLAIIISGLGLFGLASFIAEQRTKEISIRKVFGAPVRGLFYLVSKDFTRLVLISFIISVPVGWYLMTMWLNSFAYRINLGVSIFLVSGGMALAIALATVSYQSITAAMANPAKILRNE